MIQNTLVCSLRPAEPFGIPQRSQEAKKETRDNHSLTSACMIILVSVQDAAFQRFSRTSTHPSL